MTKQIVGETVYFLQEGKENLSQCLDVAFRAAESHNIKKLVIFTSQGLGVRLAIENFLVRDNFRHIRLVAVTFPAGKKFKKPDGDIFEVSIGEPERVLFRDNNVPIVRAHLPFDSVMGAWTHHGGLGQDLSLVGDALSMFGGSMSLCVQAAAIACDSGEVGIAEHVIAMTADTAVLVQAAPTARILCDLVIREVLCKPAIFSVGRNENADQLTMPLEGKTLEGSGPQIQVLLPSPRETKQE